MSARPAKLALHGVLLAALVAGPLAYVASGKSVVLQVDGVPRDVHTFGSTVSDVLAQQGVTVGPHDVVAPRASAAVGDGMQIAVLHAHRVLLVVDGSPRTLWSTAGSVAGLARELGGRFPDAYLSVSRSARIPSSGLTVDVRLPKTVSVIYGGSPAVLVTTAPTWTAALAGAGLPLGAGAVLSVPPGSAPLDGQSVVVTLSGVQRLTKSIPIPFATVRVSDASLATGTSRVVHAGHAGRMVEVWRITVRDGLVVSQHLVSRRLAANPATQVVAVGARRAVARSTSTYGPTSVDALNWAALARCESGGNPRAVGGGGSYFGLYQFMLSTWRGLGGSGNPIDATAAEQTYRAKLLYLRSGAAAWPYCGHYL